MKKLNHIVTSFKESIFGTITQMAGDNHAINLAQGFPDFDGPEWVCNLATEAISGHKNQYAPSRGILPLREAISHYYQKYYKLTYNPIDEIIVANGATEALYASIQALVNPGDEVIVFEPFYDSYLAALQMAQANIIPITLSKPYSDIPDFHFDKENFISKIGPQTKLVILNNPHNPTGKIFNQEEMKLICDLAYKYDFYIISDEVYEFLTYYEDTPHVPTACFKNLWERTITISSAGKTFGLTGWKVGWASGPSHIITAIHNIKQFISFCGAHPLQDALARALPKLDDYLTTFKSDYNRKKDILTMGLRDLGFNIFSPRGTYFVLAQTPRGKTDVEFCKELIQKHKVATIPASAFYLESNEGEQLIRFCFAKKDETLYQALSNLKGISL